jgi:hypothetical protein
MNSSRHNSSKFCRKLPLAVAALLRSRNIAEAAQAVEISESTFKRWQRKSEFAAALHSAQQEIFLATANSLRTAGIDCAATLATIARDPAAPPAARVRACTSVLTFLLKINEADNYEVRLTRIEAALKRRGKGVSHG